MCVSIVIIRAIVGELRARNLDPDPLLQDIDVDAQALRDIRTVVSLERVERFVQRAMAVSDEPALGLYTGAHAAEASLLLLGPLLQACATLREAIHYFQRYSRLFAGGVHWAFREATETSTLGFRVEREQGEVTAFFHEYIAALALRVGRHFRPNSELGPVAVALAHGARTSRETYERIFACDVTFEAAASGVRFASDLLDLPQPHADPIVRGMCIEFAERLLHERTGRSMTERVRLVLRYQADLTKLTAPSIAGGLGVTPRILRRRLQMEGTTLTALTSQERLRAAYEELKSGERSIKDIAERLGFSEPSAFHRAFKRWTGITPSQFSRRSA